VILVSSWSYALTNKGRQLQAKAQAGAQLVYTRMAVGSGTLSGQSLESMTALIAPVKDLNITRLKRPTGATRALIGATLTNQDVTTGFYLREIGIFATDPDDGEILYMYANAGATADYITPQGDGVIEKALNMNVFVGTAANITANIDESLVYATQQDLADAIAGIQINDATTTQKGIVQLSNATNSTAEDRAATPKAVKSAYDAAVAAQTTANAANEAASQAFQLGNERKQEVVDALIALGVTASTSDSWDTLISKMSAIIKATGNATAADVLSGKTFSNASGNNLTGSMPNRGAVNQTITTQGGQYTIPAGYHNGSGKVTATLSNIGGFGVLDIDTGVVSVSSTGTIRTELFSFPIGTKRICFMSNASSVSFLNTLLTCSAPNNMILEYGYGTGGLQVLPIPPTAPTTTYNIPMFEIDLTNPSQTVVTYAHRNGSGVEGNPTYYYKKTFTTSEFVPNLSVVNTLRLRVNVTTVSGGYSATISGKLYYIY
jgi:hypothetical protein